MKTENLFEMLIMIDVNCHKSWKKTCATEINEPYFFVLETVEGEVMHEKVLRWIENKFLTITN